MTPKMMTAAVAVVMSAGLFASGASAAILAHATRASNYTSTATTFTPVPLDDNGALSLKFKTKTPNELVKITYNAECAVIGTEEAWEAVQITVDGNEAAPASSSSFGFCTATNATDYIWTGTVRQSFIVVPTAGKHTLVVNGVGENGATSWWLGDTSLSVEN